MKIHIYTLVYLFIYSLYVVIHLFIKVPTLDHSFTHLLVCFFYHLLTNLLIHSFIHFLVYLLTYSLFCFTHLSNSVIPLVPYIYIDISIFIFLYMFIYSFRVNTFQQHVCSRSNPSEHASQTKPLSIHALEIKTHF